MEYTSLLLCLLHSPKKPCKPKKLNEQKSLELLLGTSYKVFTLLAARSLAFEGEVTKRGSG